MAKDFWGELKVIFSNMLAAFLILLLLIFVVGELYAFYAIRAGNGILLWAPVFSLMAVLFYKVIE